MKVIAYTALHYGKEYLASAIQSVIDHVDEYHVLYAARPSHGTSSDIPCPETHDELRDIAGAAAGSKLRWTNGVWKYEGEQRDFIFARAGYADMIVTVDADEIYTAKTWSMIDSEREYKGRSIKIPFVHYWRAFNRAIINDGAAPDRVIFPKGNRDLHLIAGLDVAIQHMGYAQRVAIVDYKQKIHGHRGEWRPEWFTTKFLPNAQLDVHPTNVNYWNAVEVNPDDYLPEFMKAHPNYRKALIE